VARTHVSLRAVGASLRQLRDDAGLTGRELAERLGWQPSKISRVENGRQTISTDEVAAWASAAGATPDTIAELVDQLREARREYASWRTQLALGTRPKQDAIREAEERTTLLRGLETAYVPGLLQTPDYARHLLTTLTAADGTPDDVTAAVQARVRRQEILYSTGRDLRFLVGEAVLRYAVCPPAVMKAQLDRLLLVSELDAVQLRIVPFGVRLPRPMPHGYWIYDEEMVSVETLTAGLVIRDADEIATYSLLFDQLWNVAVTGEALRSLLTAAARETR
jgi:transcriptional regulator with XRE-family HTH domain